MQIVVGPVKQAAQSRCSLWQASQNTCWRWGSEQRASSHSSMWFCFSLVWAQWWIFWSMREPMVAPMFITFSLHWLFCYLFICDLWHIYHLPINLTVVRIKVIKVIILMHAGLFDAHVAHILPNHARSTATACFYVCECYVCVMGSVGCGLKAEHGNIMDVLEENITFFFSFSAIWVFPFSQNSL